MENDRSIRRWTFATTCGPSHFIPRRVLGNAPVGSLSISVYAILNSVSGSAAVEFVPPYVRDWAMHLRALHGSERSTSSTCTGSSRSSRSFRCLLLEDGCRRVIARRWRLHAEPSRETFNRPNLPRAPPPPPPPPPVIDINLDDTVRPNNALSSSPFASRRGILAAMVVGTGLWYGLLNASNPIMAVNKRNGVALLKTKGGNVVAAAQDERGRLFLFDKAGNIYYDTEDPRVGMYIVDRAGETYNEYLDVVSGQVKQQYVGNLKDMTSLSVREVGGIDMRDLRKSVRGFKGGRVVGFPHAPSGSLGWEDVMPPNAPVQRAANGEVVGVPPFLEDYEVDLEAKGGADFRGRRDDIVEIFRSLRRE